VTRASSRSDLPTHTLRQRATQRTTQRVALLCAALCIAAALSTGCDDGGASSPSDDASADTVTTPAVIADLRVDANRDGVASLTDPEDDLDEDTWQADHGAIFLANIDDDTTRCRPFGVDGVPVPDVELAACNDAQDDIVNGTLDVLDLAPIALAPWPDAPDDATATISLSPLRYARVFIQLPSGTWESLSAHGPLTAETLRAGATLGIEGLNIVTYADQWDGVITLTLAVEAAFDPTTGAPALTAQDTAQAKVAPFILHHHLEPATQVWASDSTSLGSSPDPVEQRMLTLDTASVRAFRAELEAATLTSPSSRFDTLSADPYYEDRWTQDLFEAGWTSMPGPDGKPHTMRLILRTAGENRDISPFDDAIKDYPLRMASRVIFEQLRGPDSGGLQVFDPNGAVESDTLDSFGNLEVIPPHAGADATPYPHGRVMIGHAPHYTSDAAIRRMFESQGVQPPLYLDTSWLLVGHVDEFLSFIPADTPRGWVLLKYDGALAIRMLEDARDNGHGDDAAFTDLWRFVYPDDQSSPITESEATVTIQALLDDPDLMAATTATSAYADTQAQRVIDAVGLSPEEVISVPFLMEEAYGQHVAFGPGTVNGVQLTKGHFAAPRPYGPVVNGQDIWATFFAQTLATPPLNTTVHWVEDWYSYHINYGEVHCGSNTVRQPSEASLKWWK
jgi:protein-arginine deiminase